MPKKLIQCVVVIYECTLENSRTLQSLAACFRNQSNLAQQITLLIYDNSRHSQQANLDHWICGAVNYHHALENGGLSAAYNEALSLARQGGLEWLLLLDQDTVLHPDLLPALFAAITSSPQADICAIAPKLKQRGKIISPQIVGRFRNYDYPAASSGIQHMPVTAFNSAACMRVEAVTKVGGFPNAYWLDYLDHIMFHRLQAVGGRVLILDAVMEHQLSLQNLEMEMSLDRYANVLAAEWRFVRETGWGGGEGVHRLRLFKRTMLYAIKLHNKAYALMTLRAVLA